MDGLTIDQFRTLIAVVDGGGFSSAARQMHRSQSAVTYAIRKMEDQVGVALFDRSPYRPVLTEAGRALLPRARRILDDLGTFRAQALSISEGIEPEVRLVVDPVFPMAALLAALVAFREEFPTVRTRLFAESLGGGGELLMKQICSISIGMAFAMLGKGFERVALAAVRLVMVAAPSHPLARLAGPLTEEDFRDHVQMVLTDRSGVTGDQDFSVFADLTWRLGDLGTKHAMLLAGLGFGSLPVHMAEADLAAGRLVRLVPASWDGAPDAPLLPMCVAWRTEPRPGPAGRRLIEHIEAAAPVH